MEDLFLSEARTSKSLAERVQQIIKSHFELGDEHFPFNPERGISIEHFLFEVQDTRLLEIMVIQLKERIKNLDSSIHSVDLSVANTGIHKTNLDILVTLRDGSTVNVIV